MTDNDNPLFSRGISMDSVSAEIAAMSRNNFSRLLQAFSGESQTAIADRLVVHKATVSRMKEPGGDLERIALILAAAGIELPNSDERIYQVKVVEALRTLATENLSSIQQ